MELGGPDNKIGMTSSLGYSTNSSSKVSSTPLNSAVGETRKDQTTVHGGIIFDPSRTLDQHPLYHSPQLNPHQNIPNKPLGNPDTIPDPVPASVVLTSATGTKVANRSRQRSPAAAQRQAQATATATPTSTTIITVPSVRYRECQKNHAANMGGHVVDGCGEFMPSGEEGTVEALKCAACECHRNFHRKEIDGESQYTANSHYTYNTPNRNNSQRNTAPHHHQLHQQQSSLHQQHHRISYTGPLTGPIAPLMMTFGGGGSSGGVDESSSEDLNMFQSSAGGQMSVQPRKKRFRTKFSQEQKDTMLEFAEKLGWRIQKQDEQEVQQFCAEVGVKRQVFKVWMHNNKQAFKKKEESE